jgi:hypothetical protein
MVVIDRYVTGYFEHLTNTMGCPALTYSCWHFLERHPAVPIQLFLLTYSKKYLSLSNNWGTVEEVETPRYRDNRHMKVLSPTHRPPLPRTKYSWYSFLLDAELTPWPVWQEWFCHWKFQCTIRYQTSDLLACGTVPQPTAPLHIPLWMSATSYFQHNPRITQYR